MQQLTQSTKKQSIIIKLGDAWAVIGARGSGKTWFNRYLLSEHARLTNFSVPIYILDSKLAPEGGDFKRFYQRDIGRVHQGNTIPKTFQPRDGKPFLVWRPESDDLDLYGEWLDRILSTRLPAVINIDEISSLMIHNKYPAVYDKMLKQCRGLYQSLITASQSPSYIPPSLIRQTTHILRFRLNDEYDVTKLSKLLGRAAIEEPEHDHGFYYRWCEKPMRKSPTVYYENMQEFFGIA